MENKIIEEHFIKEIELKNIRYIKDFKIELSDTERKHLIFTGKNGCGKTTTLLEIKRLFMGLLSGKNSSTYYQKWMNAGKDLEQGSCDIKRYKQELSYLKENQQKQPNNSTIKENIEKKEKEISLINNMVNGFQQKYDFHFKEYDNLSKTKINFTNQDKVYKNIQNGSFILAYFGDERKNNPTIPKGIQQLHLPSKHSVMAGTSIHFIQYMINLRMKMLDAKEDDDIKEVEKIEFWFKRFENSLKKLYNEKKLIFKYNRKETSYTIEYGIKKFGLNELSAGYSSIISIITELILRMETHNVNDYDLQGVVLIDEIETHLHVSLQKNILPFLTELFPKIQFILTTHSPFVLSSLKNTFVCDLERMEVMEDLTIYSYDALIESYFDSDKYSQEIKAKIEVFEALSNISEKKDNEIEEYNKLKIFFKNVPTFMADELAVKINEILLNDLGKKI